MKPQILCTRLQHSLAPAAAEGRPACLQDLLDSGFACGQVRFEGDRSYCRWRFTASAGSHIGRASPLSAKAN